MQRSGEPQRSLSGGGERAYVLVIVCQYAANFNPQRCRGDGKGPIAKWCPPCTDLAPPSGERFNIRDGDLEWPAATTEESGPLSVSQPPLFHPNWVARDSLGSRGRGVLPG